MAQCDPYYPDNEEHFVELSGRLNDDEEGLLTVFISAY